MASAGDVANDGIDDLIIGSAGTGNGNLYSGETYVVFGKAGGFDASFDLASLTAGDGTTGFVIKGINTRTIVESPWPVPAMSMAMALTT